MKKDLKLKYYFILGMLLGTVCFLLIYGVNVLNVTYDSWLLTGKDLQQHYLGWNFFRNAEWKFPLGMHNSITYPYDLSIMYTDSIPLFAIPFKLLSPILPETFQYFGWFGLMCYALNGGFAALMMHKLTKNKVICFVGSLFFILASPILQRMYGMVSEHTRHTSLAAHFLIFMAICICLYHTHFKKLWKAALAWAVLGALCVVIQMYFIFIVGGIMCGYLLMGVMRDRDWKRVFVVFAAFGAFSAAVMYLLGGFSSGVSPSMGGFGLYSANLNALFNPYKYSTFFSNTSMLGGQYEGVSYLGMGMILLMVIAIAILVKKAYPYKKQKCLWKKVKAYIGERKCYVIPSIIVLVVFTLLAVSNVVYLGNQFIMGVSFPKKVHDFLNVFRSSGRFMWVIMYTVMLGSLYVVIRYTKKKTAMLLIAFCMVLQLADLGKPILRIHNAFAGVVEANDEEMQSKFWNNIPDKYERVDFYPVPESMTGYVESYLNIGSKVEANDMKMNYFYLSRSNDKAIKEENKRLKKVFRDKTFEDNVLYFLDIEMAHKHYNDLNIYNVDGNIIASKDPIEGLTLYQDTVLYENSPVSEIVVSKVGQGLRLLDDNWNKPELDGTWTTKRSCLKILTTGTIENVHVKIEYERSPESKGETRVYLHGKYMTTIEEDNTEPVEFDMNIKKIAGDGTKNIDEHWMTFLTKKAVKGIDEYEQKTKYGIKIKKVTLTMENENETNQQ